jgi:hypothetical protein
MSAWLKVYIEGGTGQPIPVRDGPDGIDLGMGSPEFPVVSLGDDLSTGYQDATHKGIGCRITGSLLSQFQAPGHKLDIPFFSIHDPRNL